MTTATAFSDAEVASIRADLPTVHGRAYLNAGTFGPLPSSTVDAMHSELAREAQNRYPANVWEHLTACQTSARNAFGELLGAPAEHVALMHTTHAGISTCLWGLDLTPGDEVVTTSEEHPGVLIPLRIMRDRRGISVRQVAWGDTPEQLADAIGAAITPHTAAVVVSHVSWVTGKIADLTMIRSQIGPNIPLIVDGAQGAAAIPVRWSDDDWDAYTVSGQKWSLGPSGSGCLAVRDPERFSPVMGGFFVTQDPTQPLSAPLSTHHSRFEFSQESTIPLVGIVESLRFLTERIGVDRALAHAKIRNAQVRTLLEPALRELAGSDADADLLSGEAHLVVCSVPAGLAPRIVSYAATHNVDVRYLDDASIRVSLGSWTTDDDVRMLVDVMERVAADRSIVSTT